MLHVAKRYWWLMLLRGVLAILLGLFCFFNPLAAAITMVTVWAVFALVDGITALWFAMSGSTGEHRWLLILQGVIGILFGIWVLMAPGFATLGLVALIAAWSLVIGVLQIAFGFAYRKEITGEFWIILSGIITVIFGIYLLANPAAGLISILWIMGAYAIIFGVMLVAFALRIRQAPARAI